MNNSTVTFFGRRAQVEEVKQRDAMSTEQQGDPYVLELILNAVPKVSLLDAARAMDGVEFWHGGQKRSMTFEFLRAES